MNLGGRLRSARLAMKLSQVDVYKRTGINNKTLSRYENGGTEPDADSLRRLAELYEVTVDWLLGRDKEKSEEFSLPESVYDKVIREAEEHYGVNLRDDPVAHQALRELILSLAKMKKGSR